jgi:U3 small nucleolar RNA-associated protein 21
VLILFNADAALNALSELTVNDSPVDVFSTPSQLDSELITLTLLPRSRWQTLLNLEVIQVRERTRQASISLTDPRLQQRNKPKEALKAPEQAPFFLPTLPGVEPRFVVESKDDGKPKKPTRRLDKAAAESDSVFYQKLLTDDVDGDCKSSRYK